MGDILHLKRRNLKNAYSRYFKLYGILFFSLFFSRSYADTYYVSTSGSDAGTGSSSSPYQTIKKAASVVSAGDIVLIYGGTYVEKEITPAVSGTEDGMITFKPNPGTGDVILKHAGTSTDDVSPLFQLSNRSYIWIEGFYFKDYTYGGAGVWMSSAEGNVIINNRFENLGHEEVSSWGGGSCISVYKSQNCVVSNNYFNNIFGDGIGVSGEGCMNNLICNNSFYTFKGKLRSWGGSYKYSRTIDIQDMKIYSLEGEISTDYKSKGNNVFAFNYGEDLYHHIWLDRDGSNNVILRNYGKSGSGAIFNESRCAFNVIQENISVDMKVGFMSAYYETTGWTIEPRWINNVAYNNETGFKIHKSERDEFRNNISYNNTEFDLVFTEEAYSNAPHTFNNNLWYSDNIANSIEFKGGAVDVPTFNMYVGDTDGLTRDPLFTNLTSGSENFTLQSESPAIGTGDNGLDLGAYAVYPATDLGWNSSLDISGVLVSFNALVSFADRGTQAQIQLNLSEASLEQVSVDVKPVAGDAVSGEDFNLSATTITFQPGETSKTVSIDFTGSARYDELIAFRLENATNANVGANNLRLFRINKIQMLTAHAGTDQTVWISENNTTAGVTLDASLSNDPDGNIVSYSWSLNGSEIATGEKPSVDLSTGINNISLQVTDNEGNTHTDNVIVSVMSGTGIWLEAECGTVGSLWEKLEDTEASNGKYVTVETGNNMTSGAPASANGLLQYTFNVAESGNYSLYLRVQCPSANDDSFWMKMDNGSFASWNGIESASSWAWRKYSSTYNLTAGNHTLTIGYREDGALLDKIYLTNEDNTPEGEGAPADNCEDTAVSDEIIDNLKVYPNPVGNKLNIYSPVPPQRVSVYNISGQVVFNQNIYSSDISVDMTRCVAGVYVLKIEYPEGSVQRKIIKQ